MPVSKLDSIYRRMLKTKFFEKGWGDPDNLERFFQFRKIISKRETCFKLIPEDYKVDITKRTEFPECLLLQGNFLSPLELYLPGIVPKETQVASFELILPKKWHNGSSKPICIHLAGTGDHFYWRRRHLLAKPLMKEANIGSIIIENPFYGLRKPKNQFRSNLHNVSDIFVIGGCLILECLVLLHWCEKNGFGPLGITGLSMGGHNASLAATNWPKPLVVVPCLSWSTASTVFTKGVMSQSINWDLLTSQYYNDYRFSNKLSQMVKIVDCACPSKFNVINDFNHSIHEYKNNTKNCGTENQSKSHHKHFNNTISNSLEDFILSCLQNNLKAFKDFPPFVKPTFKSISNPFLSLLKDLRIEDPNAFCTLRNILSRTRRNLHGPLYSLLNNLRIEDQHAICTLKNFISKTRSQIQSNRIDVTKVNWWESEVLIFMRAIMDECTHLKNYSVPYDTSLVIAICAINDSYVPREGCSTLEELWPGLEVCYVDGGHVSGYVCYQKLYRSCIVKAFKKAERLYAENTYELAASQRSQINYEQLLDLYAKNIKEMNRI